MPIQTRETIRRREALLLRSETQNRRKRPRLAGRGGAARQELRGSGAK